MNVGPAPEYGRYRPIDRRPTGMTNDYVATTSTSPLVLCNARTAEASVPVRGEIYKKTSGHTWVPVARSSPTLTTSTVHRTHRLTPSPFFKNVRRIQNRSERRLRLHDDRRVRPRAIARARLEKLSTDPHDLPPAWTRRARYGPDVRLGNERGVLEQVGGGETGFQGRYEELSVCERRGCEGLEDVYSFG